MDILSKKYYRLCCLPGQIKFPKGSSICNTSLTCYFNKKPKIICVFPLQNGDSLFGHVSLHQQIHLERIKP